MEQPEKTQNTPQPTSKNDKMFSMIGKIVVILVVVGVILFAGYYFGIHANKNTTQTTPSPTLVQSSIQNQSTPPQATKTPSETVTPTTTQVSKKNVSAGLSSNPSFSKYSVAIPSGWTDTHQGDANSDKLTITKGNYSIVIYQAAFGGGGCVYKGDPDSNFAQRFSDFVGITGTSGQFRRSWNKDGANPIPYTVCQQAKDGSYGSITAFGHIDVKSPNPSDDTTISEIDSMIASITKQ